MSRGLWFAMSARTRRSLTLLWTALFLFSLAMQSVQLAAPTSVLAASGLKAQTVQGFEVDGNLLSGDASTNPGAVPAALIVSPPMANGDDWLKGATFNNVVSLPSTSNASSFLYTDATDPGDDSAYGGGNKEDDTRDWVYENSAGPNPKTDFKHIMAHARKVGTSAFVFLGAERIDNNGTMVVDFELNKKPFKQFSVGPAKPNRSVGDLLISLEYSNGGGNPVVTLYRMTTVTDFPQGQTAVFTAVTDATTVSAVRSATNFVDLTTSGFGYTVPAFDFAEASIDLSALGITLGCPGFSSGHVRSRTGGDPGSSQLKDAAPPFSIDLNNCGKLKIEKRDANGALLGGASFTISDDPRPGLTGALSVTDGGANDPDALANGIIEFNPAEPGSYTVTETTAPSGYIKDPTPQTLVLANNGSITFTFVNTLGSIDWVKNGPNGTSLLGGATFSVTPNPLTGALAPLTVVDDGANDSDKTPGEFAINNARVGTYTVCETAAPSGYIIDTVCAEVTVSAADPTGTIAAGTFVNTLGSIDWVKNGPNGTSLLGGATFSVTPNPLTGALAPLTVVDDGANDSDKTPGEFAINNARVGTYTVCETAAPSGYIIDTVCAEVTVSAADPTGTIAAGTFVNTLGSIDWVKRDGNGAFLGGATFSVSPDPSDGAGTMTVVDNGLNDSDPTVGEFQVINVPTGTYTVTETVAPEGYTLDSTTCTVVVSQANPAGDKTCTFVDPAIPPIIRVVKTAGKTADTQVLDGLTYSTESFTNNTVYKYVVTNTGPVRLLNVTLTDDNGTPANVEDDFFVCPVVASLSPAASFTCTFTKSITADTTNVATAVGVSVGAGTEASDTDDAIVEIVGPAITVIKTAGASAGSQAADGATYVTEVFTNNVTYKYLVTNTGEVTLNGITLSDDNGTVAPADDFAVICPQATLAPAASMTCTATRTISADRTNIATATGFTTQKPTTPITATDDAIVVIQTPALTVIKTAGSAADGAVLQTTPGNVTYTYVVTNTGPLPLQDVAITDDNGTPANTADDFAASCPQLTLTVDESMTCSATRNVTVNTTNIAVARGFTAQGNPVQDDDPAIVVIVVIDIQKTANDDLVEPNQVVTYTLNVKVVNGPLANAVVTDMLPVGQTFVAGSASPSQPSVSANGRTLTWTFDSLATGDPALTITYNVKIDANATGDRQVNVAEICIPTPALCDRDDEDVTPEFPAIVLVKTAGNAADGATFITEPGSVTYTYKVTNTGPLALSAVAVRDDNGTPTNAADDFSVTCPKTTLAPAESMTCTFTRSVTVNTTNIAIARGVTAGGNPVQDDDPAVVRILVHGLLIDKTNNAPLVTLALPGGASSSLPTAKEGTTVTFSLAWAFAGDPVSNGIITDVLPLGVTYVAGSATSVAPFTFQSYSAATRTLTWTAATVAVSGSVTYRATIDLGASELAQPLVNVAAIASTQTARDTDDSQVFVPTVPLAATATPRITLPPTDGLAGSQAPSNPGFALMLILLVLAAVVLVVGFVTPVPASVRERPRR